MYTPVRATYPFSTLAETLSSLFNLRQIQDEKLVDYIERFNQEKQLAKTQLGKNFLDVFVGNTKEYKDLTEEADQKETKNKAFEQFMAVLFLRASDQQIYRNMQDEYCMDFTNKKYNYSKNLIDMVDVMRQVKVRQKTSPSDEEKSKKKSTEAAKQEKKFRPE